MGWITRARQRPMALLAVVAMVAAVMPLTAAPAPAQTTFLVCPDGDTDEACDFFAIQDAHDAAVAGDVLEVKPGTYTESLFFDKDLTVDGLGDTADTVLTGATSSSVVFVNGADTVTLRDLTITGGFTTGAGGGAFIFGNLILERVRVTGNGADANGGGIDVAGGSLTVIDSTIDDNWADSNGGGIYVSDGGSLVMVNSTVSGNRTSDLGPFSSAGGAIYLIGSSSAEISYSTIANNGSSFVGGIYVTSGSFADVSESILGPNAQVSAETPAPDPRDCGGPGSFLDTSTNVIVVTPDAGTCDFLPEALFGVDPLLGPLQDNGGPTPTMAPAQTSLAVDGASVVGCPATDQRGLVRPFGDGCDLGSVELQSGANVPPVITDPGDQLTQLGEPVSLAIVADDPDGDNALLTYSATGLPPGLSIDADTGEITGAASEAGDYSVEVFVTDAAGDTASVLFAWTVNTPPVAADDGPIVGPVSTSVLVPVLDNDTDADGDAVTIAAVTASTPAGLTIACSLADPAGACTADGAVPDSYTFDYTAADGRGGEDTATVALTLVDAAGATGTAVIDGTFGEGEWEPAATVTVAALIESPAGDAFETVSANVHFMNDAENLYLGVDVPRDTSLDTSLTVAFDSDDDGVIDEGDDIIRVIDAEGPDFEDGHIVEGSFNQDAEIDGAGSFSSNEVIEFIEISHPFNSGNVDDIELAPGDTIGIVITLELGIVFDELEGPIPATTNVPGTGLFGWQVTGEPAGSISGLVVSTAAGVAEAGYGVPLDVIPPERLLVGASEIVGAPLGAIEIVDSPLGAIPLGAIPLGAIGGTTSAVSQILLSEIPIEGGWNALLQGTPLADRPLQSITLGDAAAVVDPEVLATLDLSAMPAGTSALAGLSTAALLLGDVTLSTLGITDPADCPDGNCDQSPIEVEVNEGSLAAAPLGAIPLGAIPLGAIGELDAAPLGAIPLGAILLRFVGNPEALPLGAIPLGAIPLGAIPLGAIGDLASAPLGAIGTPSTVPLGAIPLGAIPLGAIPLGAIPLGAIPAESIPLGAITYDGAATFCDFLSAASAADPTVATCPDLGFDGSETLAEYLAAIGLEPEQIQASPLGAIDIGALPLGAIPLGAIDITGVPLGAIPLEDIATTSAPLGAIPLGAIGFSDVATAISELCGLSSLATCDADTTLGAWAASVPATTDLAATPLGAIDLSILPLGAIPLGAIDLNAVTIAGLPLGAIPLGAIDLANSPLGAIGVPDGVCGVTGSTTVTLLEAAALGSCSGFTLADLGAAADALTLADILDHLTIAFLGEYAGLGDLTFAEIVVSVLLATDFPWEDLPLDQIETRDVACGYAAGVCSTADAAGVPGPDLVPVTVAFSVTGGVVTGDLFDVTLPAGWFLHEDSPALTESTSGGAVAVPLRPPEPTETGVRFSTGASLSGDYELTFALSPGFDLGTATVSAVALDGGAAAAGSGPVTVVQGLEPDDTIAAAQAAHKDVLYLGYVSEPGDQDWWSIEAPADGYRVSVFLSNLAGDVDTFLYRPAALPITNPTSVRTVPLGSIPLEDPGVVYDGTGTLGPEVLADHPIEAAAELGGASTNRGTEDEAASSLQRGDGTGQSYEIQVTGYEGATSPSPYVLRVEQTAEVPTPSCTPRAGVNPLAATGTPTQVADFAGQTVRNVFFTNWTRLTDYSSAAEVATVQALLDDVAAFVPLDGGGTSANDFAVDGIVVPIESIPGVAAAFNTWDANPCDPAAANEIVGLLGTFVQDLAGEHPELRNVTLVGSDEQIPFARLDDTTAIANEAGYTEFEDNALFGAAVTKHYLSDAPYGDLDPIKWLDRFLYLPDLGIGRLVETPADIQGALATFLANNGQLDPATATSAGYDFLTDGAEAVRDALVNAGYANDDPTGALINDAWDREGILGAYGLGLDAAGNPVVVGDASDLIAPNAHYDHYRALPAIGNETGVEDDLFLVSDLDPISELTDTIVFTMGCHSGLNVDDNIGAANPQDWAQRYSELRAVYVGSTGFAYGDTSTVALTEQIMEALATRMDGTYTMGQALSDAKQDYLGRLGLYGVYDLKALHEVTLYGLPFFRIGDVPATVPSVTPGGGTTAPDPATGLESTEFTLAPTFVAETGAFGDFWSVGGDTQFLHHRPIQPKTSSDVSRDGLVATGALITSLVSHDEAVTDPAFGRPIVDFTGREPEVETAGTVFPSTFAAIGSFNELNPDPNGAPTVLRQRLNVIPGQYVGSGATPVQRLFDEMGIRVLYQPAGAATDFSPPEIVDVDAALVSDQVVFTVDTDDLDSGVVQVLVVYRGGIAGGVSTWTALDLAFDPGSGQWIGGGLVDPSLAPVDYLVQAVNGSGAVGTSSFKGEFYQADTLPADTGGLDVTVDGPLGTGDWYTGPVTVDTPGVAATASVDGGPEQALPLTVSGDGTHIVVITAADGSTATIGIAIDTTPPVITIESPTAGQTLTVGDPLVATYDCVDVLSTPTCSALVASGDLLDTSVAGTFTLEVTSTDAAGNSASASVTYHVEEAVPAITFVGFFPPLDPDPDVLNVVRAGRTVPVKFQLFDESGALITDVTAITGISLGLYICADGEDSAIVDETLDTSGSELFFDGEQFHYNFKTQKAWRGENLCGDLTFTFSDGSSATARFKFR